MNAYGAPYGRDEAPPGHDELDGLPTHGVLQRRLLAWVVDVLVVLAIGGVLWVVLLAIGLLTFGLGFSLFAVLPILPFLYHFLFLAGPLSATPGQLLLGLRVRRDADLGRPGVLQALVATAGLYLTLATGVVWLAVALVTRRHRTLHDLVSGLVVLRRGSLTPALARWNMAPRDP